MSTEIAFDRSREASSIVHTYMGWSAGASFLPFPIVDLLAVTAVQIKMVADLARLYETKFSRSVAQATIAGLLGSLVPAGIARGSSSLLKAVPGVGTALGMIAAPAFTTAYTYAVGRVFIQHFEAGGNVLNFNPEAMRDHFRQEFEAGMAAKEGAAAA
jgi:uncharacterized protein (DUF697 family)